MAITTALSPDRMMLAMMIFQSAAQKTADDRSGITKCISKKLLPCWRHHSRGFPVGATGAIRGTKGEDRMATSAAYNKMFPVSWTELHRDARALAWRLADLGPFKGLVAITRGGLVPAAIIARELNLRLIDTVCCSTYDRMARGAKVELLKGTSAEQEKGKGWLIVDDLVDTGVTARAVRALLPKAHFASVYAKPAGRPTVDSYITEVSQDTWILFPWDQEAVMAKTVLELKGGQ